jgi:CRP/FNR family transcriptional regulator, cyclic AMP receptor protein
MPLRVHRQARVELLRDVWLFSGCTKKELERIAAITTPETVAAGRVMARQGDLGETFYVVVDGRATVTVEGEEVGSVGPGAFFGEMALLDGGPRMATVTATTPMDLLVLDRTDFDSLLEDCPSVARRMLMALGGHLRIAEKNLAELRRPAVTGH